MLRSTGLPLLCALCACATPPPPAPPASAPVEAKAAPRVLRVLVAIPRNKVVPRTGSPRDRELALLETFADAAGYELRWDPMADRTRLLTSLLAGNGDLVAAQLTVTPERSRKVRFSAPIRYVSEVVVTAKGAAEVPRTLADLSGRRIWVHRGSSFQETLEAKRAEIGELKISQLPVNIGAEGIFAGVARGSYDLSVVDSDALESYLSYRDDVQAAFVLKERAPIAWAMRRHDSDTLLAEINRFIKDNVVVYSGDTIYEGDLDAIRKRGLLRVAIPNHVASYFFYRGQPMGFQYTMAQRLAERLGLHLEVVVPRRMEDMMPLLLRNRVDLLAAALTITPERKAQADFSKPLVRVDEVLVQRSDEAPITQLEALAGREVHVRRSSSYATTLSRLKPAIPGLRIVPVPEALTTEQLIDQVAAGEIPLTVADYQIVGQQMLYRDDVRGTLVLGKARPQAYAMRKGSPQLLAAVDAFVATVEKQVDQTPWDRDLIRLQEMDARSSGARDQTPAAVPEGALSPFDDLARSFGERYAIDWRLIVALMAEKSGFDPQARDWVGAQGVLQVLPHIAEALGFDPAQLQEPDVGLHAGVKQLSRMAALFESAPAEERMLLALAAFEAGPEHVRDAQRLAEAQQLDASRWRDNVAKTIVLLERPEFAQQAQAGYCRCGNVVAFVDRVAKRWVELSAP